MGSTADGCICLALRGGKRRRIFSDLLLSDSYKLFLQSLQTCLVTVAAHVHNRILILLGQLVKHLLLLHHFHLPFHLGKG